MDVAAPVEAAVTAFGDVPRLTVVAAAAAQLTAAVRSDRPAAAASTVRPRRPADHRSRGVGLAIVRRRVDVDEVVLRRTSPTPPAPVVAAGVLPSLFFRRLGGRGGRLQRGAVCIERHAASAVVPAPQPSADLPECRQLVPAGARAARSGHAVALARRLRVAVDRL